LTTNKAAFLLLSLTLVGCTSIKKAAVVGGASLGAGAIGAVAGGTAPALLAASGSALVTSVGADLMMDTKSKGIESMNCAPDNFFTLLGQLVETGGYALILIVLVPMLFSWLLPGPVKFKGKDK
tara:strand:- start:1819 stop:2190 length:372 start_codon:yes stop_codon:yes gene_type:complete